MALDAPATVSAPVQLFRITLISALIACITAGWVLLAQVFVPTWDGGYLILLAAIATFENLYAEPRLRLVEISFSSRLQVRLAEFALLLLFAKLLSFVSPGWSAFWNAAAGWVTNPLTFFTPEFLWSGLLLGLIWLAAFDVANGLQALTDYIDARNQVAGLAAVKSNFVIGAYALLIAVGLRHVISQLFHLGMSPWQASLQMLLPVIYFGLGLVLLGQARLALLQAGWAHDGVPVDSRLGGRWAGWGLAFVVGVCALALFMPAGDTIAGFYILVWLGQFTTAIAEFIMAILITLFTIILAPCLFLFQLQPPSRSEAAQPPPPVLPPPTAAPGWLIQAQSILIVAIAAVLFYFLIRIYLQDREGLFRGNPLRRLWNGLRALWLSLWNLRTRLIIHLPHRTALHQPGASVSAPSLWDRWRARTARERVRRLYLALLQRAAQSGYPRRPDQTPFEYVTRLEPQLPSEHESLEKLTEAFVQARYSRRDFAPDQVSFLHQIWQRLQSALRQLRK
ncbi:MAG: DUF4129 domain-containing protein [Anaerolineae bacterium]